MHVCNIYMCIIYICMAPKKQYKIFDVWEIKIKIKEQIIFGKQTNKPNKQTKKPLFLIGMVWGILFFISSHF